MTQNEIVLIVVAILGSSVISSLLTLFFTRRKIAAETKATNAKSASEEVNTMGNLAEVLDKMQKDISRLYQENIELEKTNADKARTIEVLTDRLQSRDAQLATANRQLDLLRNLAEQAPITETLRSQMGAMNEIVSKLQDAQAEASKMLLEKDKTLAVLIETNRNLELKKPARS